MISHKKDSICQAGHKGDIQMQDIAPKLHIKQETVLQKQGFDFIFNSNKCAECQGKCCYGPSGYIFISIQEIQNIANFLHIAFEDTCIQYIKKVGYRFSLIEKMCKNKNMGMGCIFFNEETMLCDIYPVRPKQCQTFPFWNLYKEKENKKELFSRCIGVCRCNSL